MSAPAPAKDWYALELLTAHCGGSFDRIEALSRLYHRPWVPGGHDGKIGVDLEAVQRAVGSSEPVVQGSISR